jgi:hypothetical protein
MNRRKLLLAASIFCSAAVVAPASAQEFETIQGATLTHVSAGQAEVWGINASQEVFRFNATNGEFVQVAGELTQVAVGGGTLLQTDAVWGLNAGSEIFQYNFSTKKLVQVNGELTQIVVGIGYNDNCHPYEVWGINANQQIFRYNYCTAAFANTPGYLVRISAGGGDVWGVNAAGLVFRYDFYSQTWVQIAGSLQQIAVGSNAVWGLDKNGYAYYYENAGGFVQMPGTQTYTQIAAGGDGVWGINPTYTSGNILRFDISVLTSPAVPGLLTQISSGTGAGVWGVNSAGQVFSFIR